MLLISLLLSGLGGLIFARAVHADAPAPNVVKITASKFQFSPDRVVLKNGVPNTLEFTSSDTTHGFLLRSLNLDLDIPAGKVMVVTVTPKIDGAYQAICDHYCGYGHGDMKMTVVVE
jgi:cytochrome c oxidase subunit 2